MILVIDNYDSFTYNLVHLIAESMSEITVKRNDELSTGEVEVMNPVGILISPGPGRPDDAGITKEVIRKLGERIPVLGICLGHQAIGEVYGGNVTYAPALMHGKTSQIFHDGKGVFENIPIPCIATRYHSLVVSENGFPGDLEITARTDDGVIMGLRHRRYPIEGIQFHPESLLTTEGPAMIRNWLASIASRTS